MTWLKDLPVRRKLTLVILATCGVALLLACVALGTYEVIDFRRALARDVTVLADVVAENSTAALAFEDEAAAGATLQTLAAEPHVMAAGLYASDGRRLAQYVRRGLVFELPSELEADGHRFVDDALVVNRPVAHNGRRLGTIHLRVGLSGLYERLRLLGGMAALALLGALGVAALLSSRLQRAVSRPILVLAETAYTIAERRDFALRAVEEGQDEVGRLTHAFNEMLDGIEERERALSDANFALQGENAERRLAESRVQAQLGRLELLSRITRAAGERQDLPSIFQVVVRSLEDDLPIDFGCVCLYDEAGSELVIAGVGARGEAPAVATDMTRGARVAVDADALARAVRGDLVYEPDTAAVPAAFSQRFARAGLRSLVLAPLLLESSVFGVLVAARRRAEAFSGDECQFLRQLSEHVALAAHQAQLYGALQQAYDDLRQTQQAVMQQERLRALGEMASGIAHDINNAISPVALYTELLMADEPNLSARARDYLEITQRAVQDVAETVARMKEFYRQREPQLTLTRIDLNRLVRQVVDLTRARWSDMPQQKGAVVRLETELAPEAPAVQGVESELREALTNLVFNAVDAMPEGGTLTFRTAAAAPPGDANEAARPPSARVEVSDTGLGMDAETKRRCLEPFFTTKGERGTGLGLAMVYGIVQRHSGDVEIDSAPGRGTTVRLLLPTPVETTDDTMSLVARPARPARLRILAVDDDPLVLRALCRALEVDGHAVAAVHGGQEAIDAFQAALERREPFAVVITDLGMPHVDGRKVAGVVKTLSPRTPVILLTGWGQRLAAEGGAPPHVDHLLGKPPKLSELRAALAEVTRASEPTA